MFKYLILLSALLLASCAAWFSVSGISQLFIGAPIAAMCMAIALEFGKIMGVSFLYRHWSLILRPFKIYMFVGSILLMLITSVGIYGYLSAAYANAAIDFTSKSAIVEQTQSQINSLEQLIQSNKSRIDQLAKHRESQENRLNQLVDKQGFFTQQRMVRDAESDLRTAQKELYSLISKKDSLSMIRTTQEGQLNVDSKLSTFYYVAKSLNVSLDVIVKWFILIIVFVFDPMSLALIIAYNSINKNEKELKNTTIDHIKPKSLDDWVPPPSPATVLNNTQLDIPTNKELVENNTVANYEEPPRSAPPAWWATPMQQERSS